MKFLRILLICLVLVLGLAALLVALAFVPAVQTWVVQEKLDGLAGMQVSLGSLAARWDTVEIADLRMEMDGAILTAPKIQATLPVKVAVWDRKFLIRQLVAKGWTLDLSRTATAGNPAAPGAAGAPTGDMGEAVLDPKQAATFLERTAEEVVRKFLRGWMLPGDGSLDGIDLEGDVLIAGPDGTPPGRIHVIIRGGELAAGRQGDLAVDATAALVTSGLAVTHVTAHGHLLASIDPARSLNRIEIQTEVSAEGGSLPQNVAWAAEATLGHRSGDAADFSLDVREGGRQLIGADGSYARATRRLTGTWKIDLRDSDAATFGANVPPAGVTASGGGKFDADVDGKTMHVVGRIDAAAGQPAAVVSQLKGVGAVKLEAQFDLTRSGGSVRVDQLEVALAGDRPVAELRWLQPFVFDEKTRALKVANPKGDWMRIFIREFPLTWLAGVTNRFGIAAGEATGEFAMRATDGGFFLRQTTPLTAAGVAVRDTDGVLGRGLDVSLAVSADYAATGWHAEIAPLSVEAAGRHVATIEARLSRAGGADEPVELAGTWQTDLDALVAAAPAKLRWVRGRSASGDFAGHLGKTQQVTGKVAVTGHDSTHTLAATFQLDGDEEGTVDFLVPARIVFGGKVSDLSAEGTWSDAEGDNELTLRLSGENVQFDHLRIVAASLAEAGGAGPVAAAAATGKVERAPMEARAPMPFWGNWGGSLSVDFKRLSAQDEDYLGVGGVLNFDHDSVKSIGGHFALSPKAVARIDGSITFDADAAVPYTIAGKVECGEVDASLLFPKSKNEDDPPVEGKFAVTDALSGQGENWESLTGHVREEFRITGKTGIVRLLKTDVAQSMPEDSESRVGNALGSAGSFVGWLAGVKKGSVVSGEKKVPKTTEAVLDLGYALAEIGYDSVAITASRGADRTLRLTTIELTAPEEHVTGTGEIRGASDRPLRSRPLSVELNFGARGSVADLLTKAGLLSAKKDELGYTLLDHPIHFGGTLEQIDKSAWHDLLLAAALRKPDAAKK